MSSAAPAARLHGDAPSASTSQAELDRRELAFVAMERTRMPMVVTDPRQPDNPIVLANRAFLKESGYDASEVIGRNCRMLQGVETDPAAVEQIRAALRDEQEITIELLNYRKDGSTFWNQLYISPIHDDAGQLLYYFASQLDTTRRREAETLEKAEHSLLKEVDHRAKNALALVQGIVRLTRRGDAEDFAGLVQGRVDALARAHAILADARWREVPLEAVLRSELEPLGTRIRIAGDAVKLAVAFVQPVALIVHELAANARHHGSLSAATGELTIEWAQDPSTRETRISWIERGGPAPPADRVAGYGHTMIAAIALRQLRGSVDYAWADSGLTATIVIPQRPRVTVDAVPRA